MKTLVILSKNKKEDAKMINKFILKTVGILFKIKKMDLKII